jgi:hypothetical protein
MSRIVWSLDRRIELARKTAELLHKWGDEVNDFDDRQMMTAFRAAMKSILTAEEERPIRGPAAVPWLRTLVVSQWPHEETTPTPTPAPVPNKPDELTSELILDSLTSLEQQVANLTQLISYNTDVIEIMEERVKRLTKLLRKKQTKKPSCPRPREPVEEEILPIPLPSPPQPDAVKITIIGILKGDQRAVIEKACRGFPTIKLSFDDGHRGVTQLPRFDELIVMHWAPAKWRTTAMRQYPQRTHVVHGIKDAIHLIHRLGEKHKMNGVS